LVAVLLAHRDEAARELERSAQLAAVAYGAFVNKNYGLTLPEDRLVVITHEVAGLTDAAVVHPLSDPLLLASVRELLVIDESAVMHLTRDVHPNAVTELLV
jgi:hypothetical protein